MAPKIGDTVRFLNNVGGGRVVRIDGPVAYVDEDGFETPVMLRECVVVESGASFFKSDLSPKSEHTNTNEASPMFREETKVEKTLPPVEETPEGEKINLVVGFEPTDLKHLSESTFDAYAVNDSNYYMYLTVATRESISDKWRLRYSGLLEPAIQEFLFELTTDDLPKVDRISVQAIPFKTAGEYSLKPAISYESRLDTTKFARLHCFVANEYFDTKVIAMNVVVDDMVQKPFRITADQLEKSFSEKKNEDRHISRDKKVSKPSHTKPELIEVDLHASVLLDNINGLSKADILNYQVDVFRKVMDENLGHPGRKIVFIHGKGEGVLRQALMKELNHRYKGHDVSDASFREYGFGATQVIIRQHTVKS